MVKLDLSSIDENSSEPFYLQKYIPKQMSLTPEAKSVQASSEAAGQITTITTVGSATSQVFMSGALS